MNLNQLAKEITKHEGLKKQVDIAQVKEVMRVLADIMIEDDDAHDCYRTYCFRKAAVAKKKPMSKSQVKRLAIQNEAKLKDKKK